MLTPGKEKPPTRPRRFYAEVTTGEAAGGYDVRLDGRPARTPRAAAMVLPTRALAELLAAEWSAQGEFILLAQMPGTRLAFTAINAVAQAHAATAAEVARYAASDLLCYFADAPQSLVARQLAHWGPVLQWAQESLGLRFERAVGVVHRAQPQETIDAVQALAARLDDFALAGVAHAATLFGSAVLAFALERDQLDGDAAFGLSRLDEAYQEERWGVDAEAAERIQRLRDEAVMLGRWFAALKG